MSTSTLTFGPDFAVQLIPWMFATFEEAARKAFRIVWDALMIFVDQHLLSIGLFLLFLLVASAFVAFSTGRWSWLGSILYNYLYFGTLWLIGFIFGPEVFANDWFKIVLVLLYGLCFWLVGRTVRGLGLYR